MHPLANDVITMVEQVLGSGRSVRIIGDIDLGRGVFSHVIRCGVDHPGGTVAVKLLRSDANGAAAVASGAAAREVLAYEHLLPATPSVRSPACLGIATDSIGRPALVLEDLTDHRWSDQLDGLNDVDLRAVTSELIHLHEAWAGSPALDTIEVRRSTPASLPDAGIDRGLEALDRWGIGEQHQQALRDLASARTTCVPAFVAEGGATLCHGDPRADNVAFDHDGRAVLFDWQQMAIQFGEADVAWLLATSVTPETRRSLEADIVASYAMARGQDAATTWHRYVLGMVLPGLSVLFLAQRDSTDERTRRFIATSIERIASAVDDLGVARLANR